VEPSTWIVFFLERMMSTQNLSDSRRCFPRTSLALALSLSIALPISAAEVDAAALRARALAQFQPIPELAPGGERDTPAQIELGRRLYFDTALSLDNSQSCNSCHRIDKRLGGVDNLPTSPGVKGENGSRNSPTVLNAALQMAQFWDGRAADLAEQAKGPVLNPVEMAMPDEATVVARLLAKHEYDFAFAAAFPDASEPISYDAMASAIAAFERTLLTHDRFDDFLGGDLAALNDVERAGLETFMDTGCAACHNGAALGGNSYMKLGLVKPYSASDDPGREQVTGNPADRQVFKTPMLRNIALTAPYFHNGRVATLDAAVRQMAEPD
jgi:cytochrome c peroxidase